MATTQGANEATCDQGSSSEALVATERGQKTELVDQKSDRRNLAGTAVDKAPELKSPGVLIVEGVIRCPSFLSPQLRAAKSPFRPTEGTLSFQTQSFFIIIEAGRPHTFSP